jgi:hypothetical protein
VEIFANNTVIDVMRKEEDWLRPWDSDKCNTDAFYAWESQQQTTLPGNHITAATLREKLGNSKGWKKVFQETVLTPFCNGKPPKIHFNLDEMQKLQEMMNREHFNEFDSSPKASKLVTAPFWWWAHEEMKKVIEDSADQHKVFIVGTHDYFMMHLMTSLRLHGVWPPFGSVFIIELFEQHRTYFVRLIQDGVELGWRQWDEFENMLAFRQAWDSWVCPK